MGEEIRHVLDGLLASEDPSVRWMARTLILGESEKGAGLLALRADIADSPRARSLLSGRDASGRIPTNPYKKWQGPHWTLWQLARIAYPPGDDSLLPLRDQVYDWLLDKAHLEAPRSLLIPGQEDRFRRCASMEGNAIWYSLRLGIDDERTRELADRLVKWQWPDGGWNCDKRPEAQASSVTESLMPLRGLVAASRAFGDEDYAKAANRAAEFFLSRRLYRRLKDGKPIEPSWGGPFELIHFPIVFYDLLSSLEVMVEAKRIRDPRGAEALDLLEARRLSDGGFPAQYRSAKAAAPKTSGASRADWGNFGARKSNELVTVAALGVLAAAGRLRPEPDS